MKWIRRCWLVLPLLVAAPGAALAQSPAPQRSTSEGVYTEAQASRGEQVHLEMCSSCHFPEDEWTGDAFLGDWIDRTARDLFHDIRETMPEDYPASLSRQQYADVLAYILKLNGMPAGAAELKTDDESLGRILIRKR